MTFKCRHAKTRDVPSIARFWQVLEEQHHEQYPKFFPRRRSEAVASEVSRVLIDPSQSIWVAIDDANTNQVIGTLSSEERTVPASNATQCIYLDRLYVDETCRNQGVATMLINSAEHAARSSGINRVYVNLWSGNKGAEIMYRKREFKPINQLFVKDIK